MITGYCYLKRYDYILRYYGSDLETFREKINDSNLIEYWPFDASDRANAIAILICAKLLKATNIKDIIQYWHLTHDDFTKYADDLSIVVHHDFNSFTVETVYNTPIKSAGASTGPFNIKVHGDLIRASGHLLFDALVNLFTKCPMILSNTKCSATMHTFVTQENLIKRLQLQNILDEAKII